MHRTLPPALLRRPWPCRGGPAGFGAVSDAAQRSGSTRPSIIPASPRSTGASTPASRMRAASSGTLSTASAVCPSADPMSPAGMPWASSSPARRLREPVAITVATRSPVPARPANVSGREPERRAYASTSAKTLPAAAPAAFGPAPAAAAAASAAAFLAQPASSTPITSERGRDVEAGGGERVADLAREGAVGRGEHERGAAVERGGRVGGAAERADGPAGDALGDVGGRQRAERRDEALRAHEHAAARGDLAAVGGDGAGQLGRRDGEDDEVVARELELGGAQDVHVLRQLDPVEVALVAAQLRAASRPARACGSRGPPRGRRGRA